VQYEIIPLIQDRILKIHQKNDMLFGMQKMSNLKKMKSGSNQNSSSYDEVIQPKKDGKATPEFMDNLIEFPNSKEGNISQSPKS